MGGACFCKKVDLFSTQGALCTVSLFFYFTFYFTNAPPCLWAYGPLRSTTSRHYEPASEKTCATTQKNVKSRVFFSILTKTKKRMYSFRGHLITPDFNSQLPKVSTGKLPTSNTLLRNAGVVFTFTRNYATWSCV